MGGGLGRRLVRRRHRLMAANAVMAGWPEPGELMALGLPLGRRLIRFLSRSDRFRRRRGELLQPVRGAALLVRVIRAGREREPTAAIISAEDLTRDTKPVRIRTFPDTSTIELI